MCVCVCSFDWTFAHTVLAESHSYIYSDCDSGCDVCRSADCVELHHEGHGASAPHRSAGHVCHHHLRHHWAGALHRKDAQELLLCRVR